MPSEDVIEGRCGCGACRCNLPAQTWRRGDEYYGSGTCCPECHYRLDPDGFARRMVDATVEDVREAIASAEALAKTAKDDGYIYIQAWRQGQADALKRLLPDNREAELEAEMAAAGYVEPKDERIGDIMRGGYKFTPEQARRMSEEELHE